MFVPVQNNHNVFIHYRKVVKIWHSTTIYCMLHTLLKTITVSFAIYFVTKTIGKMLNSHGLRFDVEKLLDNWVM